jgi:dCMP deaminase
MTSENIKDSEKQPFVPKRENYISWDDYFLGVAMLSAMRSKDPSTQVGACIVDDKNRIVGVGYNGRARGISDDAITWGRDGDWIDTKYPYVVHAEANAILNATRELDGCRIYVALFPCNECAKLIIQSGIAEVIYVSDKYAHEPIFQASRKMLELAGIKLTQLVPKQKTFTIDFDAINK